MLYLFDKHSLDYRIVKKRQIFIGMLSVFLVTFGLSFLMSSVVYKTTILTEEAKLVVMRENNVFSKEKLKEYIIELNIKFPEIVLAQAQLESSNFTSPIFKENHNFFGMKKATKRPTTNKGENRGHAYFDTWRDCVLDYGFYSATYLNDIKTEKEYLQYLKDSYAEDPLYLTKVLQIVKQNRK